MSIRCQPVTILPVEPCAVGPYPLLATINDVEDSHRVLVDVVDRFTGTATASSGFMFTGLTYTVSFWKTDFRFYCFNSHGVNHLSFHDHRDDTVNVARLFRCDSSHSLAWLLLTNSPCDGNAHSFMVTKMTLVVPDTSPQAISQMWILFHLVLREADPQKEGR